MTSLGDPSITRRVRAVFLITSVYVYAELESSERKQAEPARSQTAHETLTQQELVVTKVASERADVF